MLPLQSIQLSIILLILVPEDLRTPSFFNQGKVTCASAYIIPSPPSSGEEWSEESYPDFKNDYTARSLNLTSQEFLEGILENPNEIWKDMVEDAIPSESAQAPQYANFEDGSNDLEPAGQTFGNFFQNVIGRIAQTGGMVNRTLGNLNDGIQSGSSSLQGFIANFLERKSTNLVSLIERISNFFRTAIGIIRAVFGAISRGFRQVVGGFFGRDNFGGFATSASTTIVTELPPSTPALEKRSIKSVKKHLD